MGVLALLAKFAAQYKDLPCLAYTHGPRPAHHGGRATLWMNELYMDWEELRHRTAGLALQGSQGHHRHPGQLHGAV